ncbi:MULTISPECIES: hypothetical protein [Micromonospora]|uniref:hypothetical protein n=1 Tax=Micromonospora TaxID=1873 RepID=UPI001B358893|nr:hypothetical protein [Micromonospora sp. M61]MBQ0981240.1 hypothetical protein [Micromonospora sp. M61]WTI23905.1 hypothetical protein OG886_12795 [Micromonospora zamorensis]
MNTIVGTWLLRMKTPVGTIEAAYHFEEQDGVIHGSATGAGETTPLTDIVVHEDPTGQRVTWRQSITRPLRLNLAYDVIVHGDALSGESRAGRLPRTRVTGERSA